MNFHDFFPARCLFAAALAVGLTGCLNSFGGKADGVRREKMQKSAAYKDGSFENNPYVPNIVPGKKWEMTRRQLFGDEVRVPPYPLQIVRPDLRSFVTPTGPGMRAIWLGHATVLVEVDGVRILTDPMLTDRASPVTFAGPERFFPAPLGLADMPHIDAVVISHDHYDHLDMQTVQVLAARGTMFFVPLGVGAHLVSWGIPETQIVDMDWWEEKPFRSVRIICTPAVHYSGRTLTRSNPTLWSSWTVIGPKNRFFHSGDTGFSPHFEEIGRRFGPFQLTSIKIGAYDYTWEGIHMNPEDAVRAHIALRGLRMLPVHWATLNMAIHAWDEPIARARTAAGKDRVDLLMPAPGEVVDVEKPFVSREWWLPGK